MRKLRISIFCLAIFALTAPVPVASGQDFQTWSDIATITKLSDNWRYDGDQGIRGVLSDSDFTLLYFRPSVRYRVNEWFTVHGGIRFFKTFFDEYSDTFEIGPWQGLRFTWPMIGTYAVSHYFRLEERMIWLTQGDSDFDFSLRARYQLGFRSPNYDVLFDNGLFWTGSIELFWNMDESFSNNFVDRIRYDVGVGTKVSDAWRVQLHLIFQDARSIEDLFLAPFDSEELILRLRLFYTF